MIQKCIQRIIKENAERFIRTLKNEICKYMTSVSKNVYTGKLDDIYNKYNNTYHCKIGMKSVYVKSNTYIDLKITVKKLMITILNSTLVILSEYQNIKMFL